MPTPIAIVIIKNSANKWFTHQRSSHKKTFPNLYGLGAGGHIEPNETPEAAAKRELFEETGLTASIKFLFEIDYTDATISNNIHVFETLSDQDIQTDETEWQWSGWLTAEEVQELAANQQLCPDDIFFLPRLLDNE